MTPCEIVNIALGLEMNVNSHLLKVHKCGEDGASDPQVRFFKFKQNINQIML